MIEVIDRVPTYPGRVKLVPVDGQENTYDMARADSPIVEGTPINKALFDSYLNTVTAALNVLDNKIFELTQRVQIGKLNDGTIFGLYENGILVPYIKLMNISFDQTRALALRLDCVKMDTLQDEGDANGYQNCKIDRWLENEFVYTLDAATQSVLKTVGVPSSSASQYENNYKLARKVFLLSAAEYGHEVIDWMPNNGGANTYFRGYPERTIAKYNGSPVEYWTRSISYSERKASGITTDGNYFIGNPMTDVKGIRPAFMLPLDFEVIVGIPSTANVNVTAEVIG